ncbi:MAG: group 1 truncated hemoglobin [Planctomycetaceae bacterium]|nr:MAG: group 1 truncated hemoglobin [Planctomycetaceae bacterium]
MSEAPETLYDALGGHAGVAAVVDEMYVRVLADVELAHFFADTDLERLKRMQTAFISAMVDGPANYSGAELTEIHRGRGIERQHFSRFCSHMLDALNEREVKPNLIDQVLGRLAMFSDKVTGATNVGG